MMEPEGPFSINTGVKRTFHTVDYVLFALTLAASAGIGLFYAIKDRRIRSTDEYLLGGRNMALIPVTLSLLSTFTSSITVLGIPAEVYTFNTGYWLIPVAFIFTAMGAAHIFIPIFYNLKLTSSFEYLELRFSRTVRLVASCMYIIHMLLYMGILLYAPALALNVVTGMSLWGSIFSIGVVCTFYTALGGMKAVLWTDTLQITILFAGVIGVLIKGSMMIGGFDKAWDIAVKGQRIKLLEWDTSVTMRYTVWNTIIGGGIFWCSGYGTNQAQVQRALALPTLRKAQLAIWLNFPGMLAIISLVCMVGITMYAFYSACDPLSVGIISRSDQIAALFTMDILGDIHGVPGLFLSCVFSGALSSISSGLNALAAVLLEDFVKSVWPKISQTEAIVLTKFSVVGFGLLSLLLAFVVSQFGAILKAAYVLFGILGGPVLGTYSLGILFPWSNKWGGLSGLLTSVVFMLWIGLGANINKVSVTPRSPVSTVGCNMSIFQPPTTAWTSTTGSEMYTADALQYTTDALEYAPSDSDSPLAIYKLAHMWYSATAVLVVVVVGLIVSFLTGPTKTSDLDPRMICPFFDVFCPYLPEKIRKRLRFGVRHQDVSDFANCRTPECQSETSFPAASQMCETDKSNSQICLSDLCPELELGKNEDVNIDGKLAINRLNEPVE